MFIPRRDVPELYDERKIDWATNAIKLPGGIWGNVLLFLKDNYLSIYDFNNKGITEELFKLDIRDITEFKTKGIFPFGSRLIIVCNNEDYIFLYIPALTDKKFYKEFKQVLDQR